MPGVSTTLALYPSEGVAVVVLTNKANKSTSAIARELVAAVVPKYATAVREKRAQSQIPAPQLKFEPAAELIGRWSGTLHTWQTKLPLELEVRNDGRVFVRIDNQLMTMLSDVNVEGARLTGRGAGTIPTPDASRHPHQIRFDLRMTGGRLSGQASAHAVTLPADRVQTLYGHYLLSSYVALEKDRQ